MLLKTLISKINQHTMADKSHLALLQSSGYLPYSNKQLYHYIE
jgi:hypothetical protein